jgi:predicted methyltransferase
MFCFLIDSPTTIWAIKLYTPNNIETTKIPRCNVYHLLAEVKSTAQL